MRQNFARHYASKLCGGGDVGTALWDEINFSQVGLFQLGLWGTIMGTGGGDLVARWDPAPMRQKQQSHSMRQLRRRIWGIKERGYGGSFF